MGLQDTPNASRLHIGLFGKRNSGKSSLTNALTGMHTAIVSDVPGTTTDPVRKAMELPSIGSVLFIDTPGFDDEGGLGALRIGQTRAAAEDTDIALLLFDGAAVKTQDMAKQYAQELAWLAEFRKKKKPVLCLLSRADLAKDKATAIQQALAKETGVAILSVSAETGAGVRELHDELVRLVPDGFFHRLITADVCKEGARVLLVMPQDREAPKGRLILPQVQTLRELLDRHCLVFSCATEELSTMLAALKTPPDLIITDSQAFKTVHAQVPSSTRLTSFSVLFAAYKGDAAYFEQGARHLLELKERAHILIAEACTHRPIAEDIGRVKLPRLLKKRLGANISVRIVSGKDFPKDLHPFDIVIQCGACMFGRALVMSRVRAAQSQNVPMTNYGMAIAALLGILDNVEIPHEA